jgi:IclR family transcriptional regulator, KDG regulon repressor
MASSSELNLVASVDRAIDILEALGQSERGMQLSELSRMVGLPHSTAYRILNTLRNRNFVEQHETTRAYQLSTRILQLQTNVVGNLSLVEKAIPVMNRLAKELSASSHLAILGETEVVYLESRRGNWILNRASPSNRIAPAYCTALGKVLLASLPEDKLETRMERMHFHPRTPRTITDKHQLIAHLQEVRVSGYALDLEEHLPDISCVAAPIRDQAGTVIAALSVAALTQDLAANWVSSIAPMVMAGAHEVSRAMGWILEVPNPQQA